MTTANCRTNTIKWKVNSNKTYRSATETPNIKPVQFNYFGSQSESFGLLIRGDALSGMIRTILGGKAQTEVEVNSKPIFLGMPILRS
jgi:hypothetical protein